MKLSTRQPKPFRALPALMAVFASSTHAGRCACPGCRRLALRYWLHGAAEPLHRNGRQSRKPDCNRDRRLRLCPRRTRSKESSRWCSRRNRNCGSCCERPELALGCLEQILPVTLNHSHLDEGYMADMKHNETEQIESSRACISPSLIWASNARFSTSSALVRSVPSISSIPSLPESLSSLADSLSGIG